MITAVAYLRTSSATNVGADKDSDKRQREAIRAFAVRHGYGVVAEFYDDAVRGADRVEERKNFGAMLAYMEENGVRVMLVESASRFARDLIVQETGYDYLKKQGITLIAVDDPGAFTEETPTKILIRQVLGAVSQFEKASLVAKMTHARDRKSAELGRRIEGQKGHLRGNPELVALTKRLAEGGGSLRQIAQALAETGHLTANGTAFNATQVKRLLSAAV